MQRTLNKHFNKKYRINFHGNWMKILNLNNKKKFILQCNASIKFIYKKMKCKKIYQSLTHVCSVQDSIISLKLFIVC